MVFLRSTQRRAEQQVANPGLNESERGAVRVSGGHHNLREDNVSQRRAARFCNNKFITLVACVTNVD